MPVLAVESLEQTFHRFFLGQRCPPLLASLRVTTHNDTTLQDSSFLSVSGTSLTS